MKQNIPYKELHFIAVQAATFLVALACFVQVQGVSAFGCNSTAECPSGWSCTIQAGTATSICTPPPGGNLINNPSNAVGTPLLTPAAPLILMQPLDGANTQVLPPENGIDIFFTYFRLVWPWLIGVAAGVAMIQIIVGGLQIMAGGSADKASEGKERVMWAIGGMLIAGLAGVILRSLNSIFYV